MKHGGQGQRWIFFLTFTNTILYNQYHLEPTFFISESRSQFLDGNKLSFTFIGQGHMVYNDVKYQELGCLVQSLNYPMMSIYTFSTII